MSSRKSRRSFLASAAATAAVGMAAVPRLSGSTGLLASLAAGNNAGDSITKPNPEWKDHGVLALGKSPYAKLQSVPVHAVTIEPGFWSKRRATNVQASIPSMRQELVDHGRMDNFLRLKGRSNAPQRGPVYSDSDIYKWMEAVGFVLQSENNQDLRGITDAMIKDVVAIQEPNGYLNTYYIGNHTSQRMLPHTQEGGHELYSIGHLLQGAIAYYRATGDPTLLDAGIRFVDNFLIPTYGPAANQKPIVAGHPEIEMSLIELYRTTGNKRYLELAGYILHGDSRLSPKPSAIVYMYCGIPFTSRTKLEGHAVRAMYACCGATDYYLETGDQSYWKTLNALWEDLSQHQMYVTGGVGARSEGEAFGEAYELPNARAYGESCAAIGNMMWNWRMLAASGEARFTDVIERALYNGINSGMSLDGKLYCYRNPLAFDPATGDTIRNPWYDTTCCPPNIERTFASLPGYFYSTSKDGVYVHLYDNSEVNWHLASGTAFKLKQKTNYPWDGNVSLAVTPAKAEEFTLYVRIPGWSKSNTVKVNGTDVVGVTPGEYVAIHRSWSGGDTVDLAFDMKPQMLRANPAVADDTGRVTLQRGPVVYCMEHIDQTADHKNDREDLSRYSVKLSGDTESHYAAELLGGVMVLHHPGTMARSATKHALYENAVSSGDDVATTTLKFIPYYAWANREPSAMQVWVPYVRT
jgi:DUF1680 family protein